MRLTLLSRDAPPMPGGIADHTGLLARSLAEAGDEVTLVTRAGADELPGVEIWSHAGFDRMPPEAFAEAVAATQPDVLLWAYNPFSFGRRGLALRAEVLAKHFRRRLDARIVVLAHEIAFPAGAGGWRGAVWHHAQRQAWRRVREAADAVIVTTPDRVSDPDVAPGATVMIPVGSNLPDVVLDENARAREREALGVGPGDFLLAHLGGVGPGRDLPTAIEALRRCDAHVLFAGDTGPFPRRTSLGDRIHTTGRLPAEELARVLCSADAYLHLDPVGPTPGRRTTLVAAMQAALPIIAFDGNQTDPRMVDAACVRLVPPNEPAALAEAIDGLVSDPDERLRLGRNARALHDDVFSWGRITEQVRAVCTG